MVQFSGWTFTSGKPSGTSTPLPPRRSGYSINYPQHTPQQHAPGVAERIAERALHVNEPAPTFTIDTPAGPVKMPLGGCSCRYLRNLYGGKTNPRPAVTVKGKRYDVIRELWRVTHDRAEVPTLYRQCQNPACVQPHHFAPKVPKGRRGGKIKVTHNVLELAGDFHAAGYTWREVARKLGISVRTIQLHRKANRERATSGR